jgi:hypothetical protein
MATAAADISITAAGMAMDIDMDMAAIIADIET